MRRYGRALLALALSAPIVAMAAPMGNVGIYGTRTDVDNRGGSADGVGVGIRGWTVFEVPFVHGEFQTTTVDYGPVEEDIESLRVGGGAVFKITGPIRGFGKAEYIDFGDTDEDGVGLHAGAIWMFRDHLHFSGSLGFLSLNNTDGLELNAGAAFHFNKQFGVFADIRRYMGSFDNAVGADDFEITDIRAGGMLLWGH